ncbi:hypothetical protein Tco_1569318, partial [Tanacetum coccineum]
MLAELHCLVYLDPTTESRRQVLMFPTLDSLGTHRVFTPSLSIVIDILRSLPHSLRPFPIGNPLRPTISDFIKPRKSPLYVDGFKTHVFQVNKGTRFEGVTDWYQSQGYREPVTMSSATSDVTYTSVYSDSEPGRAFWGADYEEISEGGIPRVIVLGYDGLPLQPVAPPSPDYIPGPEDPQTPPVPQIEEEREHMIVQAHDLDYVPEPIYPEYMPLEEQPLPPVDSPTTESPGYVTESDPEE